jgi:iron complex outermembrane receptor protein
MADEAWMSRDELPRSARGRKGTLQQRRGCGLCAPPSVLPFLQRFRTCLAHPQHGLSSGPDKERLIGTALAVGAAACATVALCAPAMAQTQTAEGTAAQTLQPAVVLATRSARQGLDVPASVDVIEGEVIRDARLRINLSESLVRVPGLVVLNRQNYAQDLQISSRGFGSRASFGVRGVRLFVDGVPATFPDGQGQVSHFPLAQAERIEVLRGPFSALYGNSSGGVIALATRLPRSEPQFALSGVYGSDSTWRAGFSGSGGTERGQFALDATRFATDGTRPQSAARRDTLNLRAGFDDTPLGRLRVSLNSLAMPDAQDPLGLTRAQFDANPDQTSALALQFNTRKTTRQDTLGGDLRSEHVLFGLPLTLATSAWVGQRGVMQVQAIPVAVQLNPAHPGGVIDFDRRFGGLDARASVDAGAVTATIGLNLERLNEARRGYENFVGPPSSPTVGVQGRLRRDEANTVTAVDPYAQVEWRLATQWTAHAGVRASTVEVRSSDRFIRPGNGDDSGETRFSAVNPTAGLVFRPTPTWSLYVAYGRGFETPTLNELAYRSDGSAGLNTGLRAARSDNVEAGAKLAAGDWRSTLAVFAVRTEDDLVVRTNVGGRASFANVAQTRRDGVEASVQWAPQGRLSATVSAAWLDARFDTPFLTCGPAPCSTPTLPVARGNALPGVPELTAFAELRYRANWADLAAEWRGQSRLWVDDRNTDAAGGYATVGFSVARTLGLGNKPRVFARVDNVFDRRYAGSVIVNEGNGRFFEPAPGRTWLAGVDWPL